MSEQVVVVVGSFKDLCEWSEQNGMTKGELDERAVKVCVKCPEFGRSCANLSERDWCFNACIPAITAWASEEKDIAILWKESV